METKRIFCQKLQTTTVMEIDDVKCKWCDKKDGPFKEITDWVPEAITLCPECLEETIEEIERGDYE